MIRDSGLALCVLGLIVIDLFILTTYTATEGAKGELGVERISNTENPDDVIGVRQNNNRTHNRHDVIDKPTVFF